MHRRTAVAVVTLVVLAVCAAPASAQKLRQPSAASALKQLVSQTNKLPSSAASKKQKARLKQAALAARRNARKSPCTSVRRLATFRRTLRGIKLKKGRRNLRGSNRLKALGPASLSASRALLASSRTKRCGGGVRPSRLEEARTTILQNDANGMKLRVDLPALRFVDAEGGGRAWTKLMLPNTDSPQEPGSPGIPVLAKTLGVPEGATLEVDAGKTTSYTIDGVDVFPAQPDPVDAGPPLPNRGAPPYATGPFLLDGKDYRTRGKQPAEAADGRILGASRDITLANLQIPAAQYDAPRKKLTVLKSVDVTIEFKGGSHTFSSQLDSPWERPQRRLRDSLLNREAIVTTVPGILERCGEEMLVITNPSTLAAANTFANAKRAQGMRTRVVQTGTGAGQIGTTSIEIQSFIRDHLTARGFIHPSYVTILGDDELVPTFPGIGGIESDLDYSLRDGADEMPEVAVGRIVGDAATGVTNAINKIISYENSPPDGEWLRKATVAAEFQDDEAPNQNEDRTFILFAETARNGILNTPLGFGLTVDRIYATYPVGAVDPIGFRDGTPLPAELRKPGFAWDGDTADIAAAWNDGRYLMMHRDHGGTHAWDNPRFSSEDADALTNGAELPVVLSINCSSGAFQDDDRAWGTQALVNPNGGAAGVFGDTEVSPTDHNTQIALGFLDALVPRVLGGEGPATQLRTGEALIHGKQRLQSIWNDGATRNEFYLWHYYGDPSMQMWGGEPIDILDPSRFDAKYRPEFVFGPPRPDPPPYGVEVTLPAEFNGQAFSLLRNGDVIGKGTALNGKALLPAAFDNSQPKPGELQVAFEGDGARPVTIPVDGVPPEGKTATQLTVSCPTGVANDGDATVRGTLSPAFAGAQVELTYTSPNGRSGSVTRTATTNGNGDWSNTFSTGAANDGQGGGNGGVWTVSARYAGDSAREGSGPAECKFSEAG